MHVPVWFIQNSPGTPDGGNSLKFNPLPNRLRQKIFSTNRMYLWDLKMQSADRGTVLCSGRRMGHCLKWCVKKFSSFRCHFEVSILTRFCIFCRLRKFSKYSPYYELDWNIYCVLLLECKWVELYEIKVEKYFSSTGQRPVELIDTLSS